MLRKMIVAVAGRMLVETMTTLPAMTLTLMMMMTTTMMMMLVRVLVLVPVLVLVLGAGAGAGAFADGDGDGDGDVDVDDAIDDLVGDDVDDAGPTGHQALRMLFRPLELGSTLAWPMEQRQTIRTSTRLAIVNTAKENLPGMIVTGIVVTRNWPYWYSNNEQRFSRPETTSAQNLGPGLRGKCNS